MIAGKRTTTGLEFASITNDANKEYIFTLQETAWRDIVLA